MSPALDIGIAVGACAVADGEVEDTEVEFSGTEQEVEVTEGIEVAEVGAVLGDFLVVLSEEHLGAAESILEGLAEEVAEGGAEELIAEHVEEAHGFVFHGVDEADPVDELGEAGADEFVIFGEVFRGHGEVGIEDEEDIAGGGGEGFADGAAFSAGQLLEDADVFVGVVAGGFLDGIESIIGGVAFDEDDFGAEAHVGGALDGGEDITGFIAGGDDDGAAVMGERGEGLGAGSGDHEDGEAEVFEEGGDPAVEEGAEDGGFDGPEDTVFLLDLFPAGEVQEVVQVVGGEPVLLGSGGFGAEAFGESEDGAPEVVEGIEDEAGVWGGELVEILENGLDVGKVVGEVGEDDVVEGPGGGGGVGGSEMEFEFGEALFGLLDD